MLPVAVNVALAGSQISALASGPSSKPLPPATSTRPSVSATPTAEIRPCCREPVAENVPVCGS